LGLCLWAEAAPFYEGKSIEVIVAFREGGGTDVWIRIIAPFLERHIEGNPRIVVRNIPGGQSIHGVNVYYLQSPPDGLHLLASSGSNYIPALFGQKAVKYDFAKLKPVLVNGVGAVIYVAPQLGIKKAEDLAKAKGRLIYAGISATGNDIVSLLGFDLLGLETKEVLGYEGRGPARLAFERGESNIDHQTTPAYAANVVPLVRDGKAIPLMTLGQANEAGEIVRDPAALDLPTVPEVYERVYGKKPSGPHWEAYKNFLTVSYAYQKILWVKPEAPPQAIDALFKAADRLLEDASFQKKAEKILEGYPLQRGDRVEKAVRQAFQISTATRQFVKEWLQRKYNIKVD
jgi:tripartite-type tricarboxylate transporter receptor subunit TctC